MAADPIPAIRETIVKLKLAPTLICGLAFAAGLLAFRASAKATSDDSSARKAIEAFNAAFSDACLRMDHPASAALWADDGSDLIEGLAPLVGKQAITGWLNSLTPQLKGAKMIYCTVDWKDIQLHGDLAYEWGINKQKIEFPAPQQPFVAPARSC
jgi:ketosteroid isomerase-like protein